MAIKKELIIEILPDGDVKIKSEGFKGTECEEEMKPIEKALGEVKTSTKTSEYYQQDVKKKTNVSNSTK